MTNITAPGIWYKGQRVLRTALATALTILPLVPQIIQIIQGQWGVEWLSAVAGQAIAINSALTAIMALPTVNTWLTKIGFGSVPRAVGKELAAVQEHFPGGVITEEVVIRPNESSANGAAPVSDVAVITPDQEV